MPPFGGMGCVEEELSVGRSELLYHEAPDWDKGQVLGLQWSKTIRCSNK